MSRDPLRDLSHIGGIGFTLVAYVLVFTGGGYLLDRLLETGPWLMVAGVFIGAALGFFFMVRTLIAESRVPPDDEGEDDGKAA